MFQDRYTYIFSIYCVFQFLETSFKFACGFVNVNDGCSRSTYATLIEEYNIYIHEPAENAEVCPLEWWAKNRERFQLLHKVAKTYLCIPSTSEAGWLENQSSVLQDSSQINIDRHCAQKT